MKPSLRARISNMHRSALAIAATAALATGLLAVSATGAAPNADADPAGKDLVVFGDSFSSNPTLPAGHIIAGTGPTSGSRAPVAGAGGCPQDPENWPRVAAGILDVSLADYSCNGTGRIPYLDLTNTVIKAVNNGDLGPSTRKVALMYGGLDAIQWVDTGTHVAGVAGNLPSGYHATIAEVQRRVRQAAPNAEIVMAGYPEFGAGDNFCVINTTPDTPSPIMVPGAGAIETGLQSSIRSAADAHGMRFIDLKSMTAGHGTCAAPDSQRYVAGIYDQTSDHNMKLHPTLEGSRAMGRIMADNLR
ncbi:GDSL-type esterase/lipase family protein [Corynebacterium hansenii]|uniref:GDSL-type esterase/lipase family protein n=1 Tax=Corynebacterium hansenii TaxID=394964 RepID=A0ABV7ZQC9_9CORY|nr:GDSL-type esterase/lipase family protein [Corynebacterium hansenii]WJY98809.1 Lipase 2 precursor [Corynebacterium hansenii]